jgi:hypothetical protein
VANNTAHSNMFYGLRVHPEFYPLASPCDQSKWLQVRQQQLLLLVALVMALCCC